MVAHVTGDAGVDVVLDAIEAAQSGSAGDRRHTLIHAYFVRREDGRARRAPLASSSTPSLPGTTRTPTRCRDALGRERVAHFIGLDDLAAGGVEVAINTDHMFGLDKNEAMNPFNPFLTIYAATTRRTESGRVVDADRGRLAAGGVAHDDARRRPFQLRRDEPRVD